MRRFLNLPISAYVRYQRLHRVVAVLIGCAFTMQAPFGNASNFNCCVINLETNLSISAAARQKQERFIFAGTRYDEDSFEKECEIFSVKRSANTALMENRVFSADKCEFNDIAATGAGGFIAVGGADISNVFPLTSKGQIVVFSRRSKVLTKIVQADAQIQRYTKIVQLNGTTFVALASIRSYEGNEPTDGMVLVKMDGSGRIIKKFREMNGILPRDIRVMPDQSLLVFGVPSTNPTAQGWVGQFDAALQPVRALTVPDAKTLLSASRTANAHEFLFETGRRDELLHVQANTDFQLAGKTFIPTEECSYVAGATPTAQEKALSFYRYDCASRPDKIEFCTTDGTLACEERFSLPASQNEQQVFLSDEAGAVFMFHRKNKVDNKRRPTLHLVK